MKVSNVLECELTSVSPDSGYVACAIGRNVNIFSVCALELVSSFVCKHKVKEIQWCPRSQIVACHCDVALMPGRRRFVQLRSIADASWRCSVKCDTSAFLVWSPVGGTVLLVSDINLCASVWLFPGRTVLYIKYLKPVRHACLSPSAASADGQSSLFSCRASLAFSPDGCRLAAVESRDGCDHISVFDARRWTLLTHVQMSVECSLAGVVWSPECNAFCAHEDWLRYRLLLYNATCRQLAKLQLARSPLGVSSVQWSSNGQLLIAAGFDEKVRVVSRQHWTVLACWSHMPLLFAGCASTCVYRQQYCVDTGYRLILAVSAGHDPVSQVNYVLDRNRPVLVESDAGSESPSGHRSSAAAVSPRVIAAADGAVVATWYARYPQCVWLWDLGSLSLHSLIVMKAAVSDMCWSRDGTSLAVCTRTRHVCVWRRHLPPVGVTCQQAIVADTVVCYVGHMVLFHGTARLMACTLNEDNERPHSEVPSEISHELTALHLDH